jgi:predicted DNA-binding transcriptional regulator AlpA
MDLTVTNLTLADITRAMRSELETFFAERLLAENSKNDEIGGIELAIAITGLAKATIYGLVAARQIPHSKRGKKLYFSRGELLEWIGSGKRRTQSEIAVAATHFGQKERGTIDPTKRHRSPKVN